MNCFSNLLLMFLFRVAEITKDLGECEHWISECNVGYAPQDRRAVLDDQYLVSLFLRAVPIWHCVDSAFHCNVSLSHVRESCGILRKSPSQARYREWEECVSKMESKLPISLKPHLTLCVC